MINRTKLFLTFSIIFILAAIGFIGCKKSEDPIVESPPEEFINYTVNGIPYSFVPPVDSILALPNNLAFTWRIYGNRKPVNANYVIVSFDFIAIHVGTKQHLLSFNLDQIPANAITNAPIFVSITECGTTGQFIAVNFSGSYTGPAPTNIVYNITCNFRIKRNF